MLIAFKHSNGVIDNIGESASVKDAFSIINKDLEERIRYTNSKFKSYYTQCSYNKDEHVIEVDVGSWSEFYYIYCSELEFYEYLNYTTPRY